MTVILQYPFLDLSKIFSAQVRTYGLQFFFSPFRSDKPETFASHFSSLATELLPNDLDPCAAVLHAAKPLGDKYQKAG